MLNSMTGFGAAHGDKEGLQVSVEARSLNGRFLRVSIKGPASIGPKEADLEQLVRARVQRGTVSLSVHMRRSEVEKLIAVNEAAVRAYQNVFRRLGLSEDTIPLLAGVIGTAEPEELPEADWQLIATTAAAALDALLATRAHEGRALHAALSDLCERIEALRTGVKERIPAVVSEYQRKLEERLARLLEGAAVAVDAAQVAREVAVLADRSDVSEEVERLGAHVAQARSLLAAGGAVGRTLDFLAQEMQREASTLGAKSADVMLSRAVVDLKAVIEQLKEQAANVE